MVTVKLLIQGKKYICKSEKLSKLELFVEQTFVQQTLGQLTFAQETFGQKHYYLTSC